MGLARVVDSLRAGRDMDLALHRGSAGRMNLASMTVDEIAAEAARRAELRRLGKPLTGEQATDHSVRTAEIDERAEKEIQRDVHKLYRAMGCELFWMSQARKTRQTPGVPDLIVFHVRLQTRQMWFHECKTPRGGQSPAQKYFEEICRCTGIDCVVGGVSAAEDQLIKLGVAERIDGRLEPKQRVSNGRG